MDQRISSIMEILSDSETPVSEKNEKDRFLSIDYSYNPKNKFIINKSNRCKQLQSEQVNLQSIMTGFDTSKQKESIKIDSPEVQLTNKKIKIVEGARIEGGGFLSPHIFDDKRDTNLKKNNFSHSIEMESSEGNYDIKIRQESERQKILRPVPLKIPSFKQSNYDDKIRCLSPFSNKIKVRTIKRKGRMLNSKRRKDEYSNSSVRSGTDMSARSSRSQTRAKKDKDSKQRRSFSINSNISQQSSQNGGMSTRNRDINRSVWTKKPRLSLRKTNSPLIRRIQTSNKKRAGVKVVNINRGY